MTIDEIEYFFKILESGSISRASEGLYISRQGLGKSLDNLEKDVGATLFVRTLSNLESIWMGDLEYDICIGPNHRLSGLEHIPEEEMLKEAFPR